MVVDPSPIRILSIDGGGMRGVIPAMLLRRLDELIGLRLKELGRKPQPLAGFFDLIAGTSTGAIVAASIAGCKPGGHPPLAKPDELINFYQKDAALVFRVRWWDPWGIFGSKYDEKPLEGRFDDICGDALLSQVAVNLIVPAFTGSSAHIFRGGPGWTPGSQPDYHLRDVLRATTSAPYLFEPARITAIGDPETHVFIDGGMFANNPSLLAYLEARELFGSRREILLISLGTGNDFKPIDYHVARKWGGLGWLNPGMGVPLIQVLMQGQSHDTHRNLRRLIPDQRSYVRLDLRTHTELPSFDDASATAIRTLSAVAESFVSKNDDILASLSHRLVAQMVNARS
jgi:patatin-like phospholipase/acyl hydrolase